VSTYSVEDFDSASINRMFSSPGDPEDVGHALVLQALHDQLSDRARMLTHGDKRSGARFCRRSDSSRLRE
jgi:hypothetical protein